MTTRQPTLSRKIFCHRGLWGSSIPQNSMSAHTLANKSGFNIETDIRRLKSEIVLSHDSPQDFESLELNSLAEFGCSFALNIKEDGLLGLIEPFRLWINDTKSFVFDGSLPEMHRYHTAGIPHALRLSEYEKVLPWDTRIIWLDSFHEDWWLDNKEIASIFGKKRIIVVSPELHGRDPRHVWDYLLDNDLINTFDISLCTDKPLDFLSWN